MKILADQPANVLRETSSVTLARCFLDRVGTDGFERRIVRFWRGDFYQWDGTVYVRQEPEEFRAAVYEFLKGLKFKRKGIVSTFMPEPRNVKAVIETLATECQARAEQMPAWLDPNRPDPADIISFRNGLLNLHDILAGAPPLLIPPSPFWFSSSVIPYDFKAHAHCPAWLAFLNSVMRKEGRVDEGAINLLQEWFGYCLTADTRHQKLLLLIGPPRCGKGTIIRAMQRVVGSGNFASPQFASLTETFGLEPLLGKRIATVPDAHLGRDDNAIGVLDRILQISGEDCVTVNRKYKPAIPDVRLGVRFTIGANEPPDLPDSSGAIITRLLMIQFVESFAGREDVHLDEKLASETAGIAAWAIEGLKRLRRVGRFSDPSDADKLRNDYRRQTAPILAFVQDRCELGTTSRHWAEVECLWTEWKTWAQANGHHPGSKEGFGKRLRSACPGVYKSRVRRMGRQQYEYLGVMVLPAGELPFGVPDMDADEPPSFP